MQKRIVNTIATILLVATTQASAGVAEKKARKAADKDTMAEVALMQASCGNAAMTITYDWGAYDTFLNRHAGAIEAKGTTGPFVIQKTALRTINVVKALTTICDNDPDYKEEIAKLTGITVSPKSDFEDFKSEFSLSGGVITALTGHQMHRAPSDFEARLKELF